MKSVSLLPFALLAALASANPWTSIPEATPVADQKMIEMMGISPLPTANPALEARNIFKRQSATVPDYWCGYITGDAANTLTCAHTRTCQYNTINGAGGCCLGGTTCTYPTACIASTDLSAKCDSSCTSNSYITKCYGYTEPYCATWLFQGATRPISIVQCDSAPFTSIVLFSATTTKGIISTTDDSSTITSTPTSSSSIQSSTSTTSSATSASSSAITPTPAPGKSTPVGPIVGGVVGGVAVLGIGALAILLLLRRNKKKVPTPAPTHDPNMVQPGHQSGYFGGAAAPVYPSGVPPYDHNQQWQHQAGSPQPYGAGGYGQYPHSPNSPPPPAAYGMNTGSPHEAGYPPQEYKGQPAQNPDPIYEAPGTEVGRK